MEYLVRPHYDLNRPHNPWEQFTRRDETKHGAEDGPNSRLCLPSKTTVEVVQLFMAHKRQDFDKPIPRQNQILKDFLDEVKATPSSTPCYVGVDIRSNCKNGDIALLDDRQRHPKCAKVIGQTCPQCQVYFAEISIPDMYTRLGDQRSDHKAEKRTIFIPNITPAGALVIAATVAKRSTQLVRDFLQRHLGREDIISASTLTWGFFFEFHICYHAMRKGPVKHDSRTIRDEQLRLSEPLPLRRESKDGEELYYYEAQTSSLSWGPDEWFWTEIFLVDTWYGSEESYKTYVRDELDPPLAGGRRLKYPCYDPREYFLLKLERRLEQAVNEYHALIGTFHKRMKEYRESIKRRFHDDGDQTLTRTLSDVINTIQTFADSIGSIIEAWNAFHRTQISLFTIHAPEKLNWPQLLDNIIRQISELARLRRLLLTQRERFKFKLDSLHTVSNLNQTETANEQAELANRQAKTAVSQGTDLKILTQMTVFVAFPLLFTTAFFSMDFVRPPYPGAVFTGVLIFVGFANYMIAMQRSPVQTFKDLVRWIMKWLG